MKISDYAKAQGWLKRHASSENSAGEWEKYVALNTTPELDIAIKTINDKYGPGTVFPASEAPIPPKTLDRDMWESANERLGFNDGQLVTPSVDGSRPGYAKKKGSNWKSRYKIKAFDEVADLLLQTYAKDDIDIIYKIGKETENKLRYVGGDQELIDYISNKTKDKGFRLSEKDIFDILDDRKAHSELMKDIKVQEGKAKFDKPRKDLNNKMRNWLMTNSKKYADPEKFEKSFNRVFGKNNYIAKGIRKNHPSASVVGFVDENFVKTYLSDKVKPNLIDEFPFSSNQLKNMFKTLIYNNNENVRNKVVQTFSDILPKEKIKKTEAYSVYKAMKNNEFLKKFNLNKGIQGPVARLIANKLDEKLVSQIENFQNPWLGSRELLNYLGDHVDPKYKSMFKEAEKAVLAMQSDNWSKARSYLDTGREIMFDHKIPSSLIEAGYADEIEYIKMNPTSKEFNVKIKSKQFDAPMNRLAEKFEKAKTLDAKTKIYEEMVAKKDAFSKKYGNYLDEVDIKFDKKTGKLRFTSDAPVVTKKTDLTKMLEKSLQQEKFSKMSNEEQMKFLKEMGYRCNKSTGGGETLECYMDDVKKTRAEAKKGNVNAINKQRKAFDVAAELPKIGKLVRQGVQAGAAGLATAFKWTGLGSPIGYAIEGAIEGGVYDYYRGKGYNHEQAFAETLIPGLVKGRPEGVPWYGGAEELIEKEKIGTRWDPSGKVNAAAKYADAKSRYDEELDKYNLINANMTTYANVADWEKDLNAQAQILKDLEPSIKPGTPEYEAYQTAEERQTALMDQRARDYKSKNRFLGWEWDLSPAQIKQQTPSPFMQEQKQKDRYKAMDKYKTTSWGDPMEAYSLKPGERFDWDAVGFGGEQGIKDKWQQIYEIGGMDLLDKIGIAGGVSKMSSGGIAGVKKVDPDELKEAQEKMKKLMKQYKNKNLDWDAVKRSYKIWTK
jgi:hypothetical protein